MSRLEQLMWIAIWPIIAVICILMLTIPSYGNIVECNTSPGTEGQRWLWREIDGRRCWFRAQQGQRRGQDQPKSDLYWKPAEPPPMPEEPEGNMSPPWEMEHRWPIKGWDHKE